MCIVLHQIVKPSVLSNQTMCLFTHIPLGDYVGTINILGAHSNLLKIFVYNDYNRGGIYEFKY